jgi:hypothetical protein
MPKYRNELRSRIREFERGEKSVELKYDLSVDGYKTGLATVILKAGGHEILHVTLEIDAAEYLDRVLCFGMRALPDE